MSRGSRPVEEILRAEGERTALKLGMSVCLLVCLCLLACVRVRVRVCVLPGVCVYAFMCYRE